MHVPAHVMRRDPRMRTLTYAYVCALGSAIIAMQCILRAPTATPSVMKRSSGSRAIRRAPQDLRLRTSWPGVIVGVNVIELEEAQPQCQMRDGGATAGGVHNAVFTSSMLVFFSSPQCTFLLFCDVVLVCQRPRPPSRSLWRIPVICGGNAERRTDASSLRGGAMAAG